MLTITPTGQILGATITGLDLAQPLGDDTLGQILIALGQYGVLRFPGQQLTSAELQVFSERFGDIQESISKQERRLPGAGVGILSNVMENGAYIGLPDAGQDWHTDMSYREVMGFVNVLYGITIPRRNGITLGGTEFANMHLAYAELPDTLKTRLHAATAVHDFEKFWENMRQNHASSRPALTDEQRRRRLPVIHPIFLTHPITGHKVLYANPGYTIKINGMSAQESAETLDFLFAHQLQERFRYRYTWTEGDVLVWEHFGTIHRAIADYAPDEHRLMKRCQVMATKIFDPGFRQTVALDPVPVGSY
jgi:taurine dioxygenase